MACAALKETKDECHRLISKTNVQQVHSQKLLNSWHGEPLLKTLYEKNHTPEAKDNKIDFNTARFRKRYEIMKYVQAHKQHMSELCLNGFALMSFITKKLLRRRTNAHTYTQNTSLFQATSSGNIRER